jgi:protocatechuate 3,4-dioxygenase beta subunit
MVSCGSKQAADAARRDLQGTEHSTPPQHCQTTAPPATHPGGDTVRTTAAMIEADPDSASASQAEVSVEIAAVESAYQRAGVEETQPRLNYAPYRSSLLRHPTKDLHHADPEGIELWTPCFGQRDVHPLESDLTIQHPGQPIGERMVVTGRIVDGDGRPVRRQLVEIWQANAGGRYVHKRDQHPCPLDPNFTGVGRCLTDDDGRYRFTTIKPGPYPWKNHRNAWRPAHIHFSLFGTEFTQRMITQMYFPGDPLFALDPIYQSIADQKARDRLVASYDHDVTTHEWSTGYRWDIVLTGASRTPLENHDDGADHQ